EEVKGSVIVNYVDTEGTKIGTEFKDTTDGEVGSAYDTTVNTGKVTSDKTTERPSVITKDGKTYRLVAQATDATVGQVASDGHLTSNKEGFHYGTDEVKGQVAEGTKSITYVYEEVKGSVIVNYVDTEGTKIGTEFKDTTDGEVGSAYDTTVNTGELTSDKTTERPSVITKDGKTYRLVAQATDATVGQVASDGHLTSNKEGFHYGTDEVKGQVAEGTKSITYVYEEVKGSVIVNYVDTEGNTIGTEFKDTTDGEVGSAYDTTVNTGELTSDKTTERPSVITKDGKTYRLVAQATDATVGQVATDGHLTSNKEGFHYGTDEVKGQVAEGTKSITYVYEEVNTPTEDKKTGSVLVRHITDKGEVLADTTYVVRDGEVGSTYETSVGNFEGYTFVKVDETGVTPTGEVEEGEKTVVYIYTKVETPVVKTGSVVARYVIEGTETE
ncbi:MucBP domain-containing protein, partial [Streptococcus sp. 2022WUSS037]|uniref:MucBP domain-containing protein n=1 Tax=Streptococcus sp. 2022WUSS037 TaxID=2983286 RepID=UPI0037B748FE